MRGVDVLLRIAIGSQKMLGSACMKRFSLAVLSTALAGVLAAQAPPKTHLKVGDTAPDFELPSTQGKKIKLSDYRGKKNVVVAFFPAAFTGG
jgi:cytochrome oxidase Cu insertion factor (SCO1/SenC/PrrC family)